MVENEDDLINMFIEELKKSEKRAVLEGWIEAED